MLLPSALAILLALGRRGGDGSISHSSRSVAARSPHGTPPPRRGRRPSARALGRYRQRLPRRHVLGGRVPGAPSYVAGSPSRPGFWPLVASAFCPGCPRAGCGSLQASSPSPSAPTPTGPLFLALFLDQSVHRRGAGGSSQAVPRWQSPAVPRGPQTTAAGSPRVPSGTAAASGDLRLLPLRAQRCGPPGGSCLLAKLSSPSSSLSPEFEFLHFSRP